MQELREDTLLLSRLDIVEVFELPSPPSQSHEEDVNVSMTPPPIKTRQKRRRRQDIKTPHNNDPSDVSEFLREMKQNYVWQRSALQRNVSDTLFLWVAQHMSYPYPDKEEIQRLVEECRVDITQLRRWLKNTRRRFWLPIVHERLRLAKEAGDTTKQETYSGWLLGARVKRTESVMPSVKIKKRRKEEILLTS